jgi:hypothetical protein
MELTGSGRRVRPVPLALIRRWRSSRTDHGQVRPIESRRVGSPCARNGPDPRRSRDSMKRLDSTPCCGQEWPQAAVFGHTPRLRCRSIVHAPRTSRPTLAAPRASSGITRAPVPTALDAHSERAGMAIEESERSMPGPAPIALARHRSTGRQTASVRLESASLGDSAPPRLRHVTSIPQAPRPPRQQSTARYWPWFPSALRRQP